MGFVGRVTKPRFAIVFLMILALGLPQVFAAEDVTETTYDESETAAYEGTPRFSIVAPPVGDRITQHELSCLHPDTGAPSLFAPARILDNDANRSADARISLTQLCTLLC
jgi:hypothetical protein